MGLGLSSKDSERGLLRMNERFCSGEVSYCVKVEERGIRAGYWGCCLRFLPFSEFLGIWGNLYEVYRLELSTRIRKAVVFE